MPPGGYERGGSLDYYKRMMAGIAPSHRAKALGCERLYSMVPLSGRDICGV